MRNLFLLLIPLFWLPLAAAQTTFEVIHKKRFWPDGRGEILISTEGIAFRAAEEKKSRRWAYSDIQYFDRVSEQEFVILSYEDEKWKLGRDRQFRFVVTSGKLTDALFVSISERLGRPVTDRVFRKPAETEYEMPVKHLHGFGGCEGMLVFTPETVSYSTKHAKDARVWRLGRDVESVWSSSPYHLELHVYDNNRREFSRTRVYKFDLKRPLDSTQYRDLKLRLYDLDLGEERSVPQ